MTHLIEKIKELVEQNSQEEFIRSVAEVYAERESKYDVIVAMFSYYCWHRILQELPGSQREKDFETETIGARVARLLIERPTTDISNLVNAVIADKVVESKMRGL